MQISSQLWSTNFTQNTQNKTYNVVVIAAEVDSDTVSRHHQEFRFLVEKLGETLIKLNLPKYPIRFSIRELLEISLRHSICPKLVSWPDMLIKSSLVTLRGLRVS
jgi:hypothetical protein